MLKYLHQSTVEVAASHATGCQVAIGNSDSDHGKNEDNGIGDVIEPNGAAPHAAGYQGSSSISAVVEDNDGDEDTCVGANPRACVGVLCVASSSS